MSFSKLKKDELVAIAVEFGVELESTDNKDTVIAKLAEDGVTYEDAVRMQTVAPEIVEEVKVEVEAEREQVKADEPKELIKMERENGTYEVRGYRFTKASPFALVSESDAEWITDNVEGFRYAKPREAAEFYG